MKSKAFHIGSILIGLLTLLLTFYLTDLYLKQNFAYGGEAYLKGTGHLLQENFWKAFLFLSIRHLLVSSSCFYVFFALAGRAARRGFYQVLKYLAIAIVVLVVVYTTYMGSNMVAAGYDRADRMIEIALTWLLRVAGLFIGYRLAMAVMEHSPQKQTT